MSFRPPRAPRRRRVSAIQLLLVAAVIVMILWTFILVRSGLGEPSKATSPTGTIRGADSFPPPPQLREGEEIVDVVPLEVTDWRKSKLNNCEWIKERLANGESIGEALPESGKDNFGTGVRFWLKKPVLHTRDPASGAEVMILMYNIYNTSPDWTQHTDKFRNTVKVLLKNRDATIFPKLFAFCENIKGFHYIAVEYIDYDVHRLAKPQGLQQCVQRAIDAIELFRVLDEDYHLFLADLKPGQWMARKDGSLVLQDVDDIVPPKSPAVYPDQVEWHQGRIASSNRMSSVELHKAWNVRMFPRGELSIRYDVVCVPVILENLGFNWNTDCGMTREFKSCLKELKQWTVTVEDDWPSPMQVKQALSDCLREGRFERHQRPPASWRDLEPMDLKDYVPKNMCTRGYDRPESGGQLSRCEHSCCRSKGNSKKCYYKAPEEECRSIGI